MSSDDDARPAARLTVLSGPSGVGKDSVIELIRARSPWVWLSVSVTTRRKRDYEVDGVHYHFVDRAEFERLVDGGQLLEWAEFAGNLYGTPRGAGRGAARRGQPGPAEDRPAGRPAGHARRCPTPSWSSSPRRAVEELQAPADRPRHRRRGDDPPPAGRTPTRRWPPRRSST